MEYKLQGHKYSFASQLLAPLSNLCWMEFHTFTYAVFFHVTLKYWQAECLNNNILYEIPYFKKYIPFYFSLKHMEQ